MKIIADILNTLPKMPKFNSFLFRVTTCREAGATADIELGLYLADGLGISRAGVNAGMDIDAFAHVCHSSGLLV